LLDLLRRGDPEERIYVLWALGAIGDPAALPSLQEALGSDDPGLRKTAAYALGELALPESAPRLRVALEDPVADVRWNAALALARLGSDAGLPVLEEMLDRASAGQVPGITPEQQEDAMIEAVRALAAVGGERSLPLLDGLARTDPSLKVRQVAIEASRAVRERSGQG
jgi:HEAT repeat protein